MPRMRNVQREDEDDDEVARCADSLAKEEKLFLGSSSGWGPLSLGVT
jgi:hypothetical protein